MKHTQQSLDITETISDQINDQTFHHHYHILYDIGESYPKDYKLVYVEIGCYAGGSACLMLQRPNTIVISIDLGHPIPFEIVHSNVSQLNTHHNTYHYLKGNSQSYEMVHNLQDIVSSIDILFIDGDHSYQGVINDFLLYEGLVRSGGYIVFDDYNDFKYSPEVRTAVDAIIPTIKDRYEIMGTLPNIYNARPDWLKDGNDFIIRKK